MFRGFDLNVDSILRRGPLLTKSAFLVYLFGFGEKNCLHDFALKHEGCHQMRCRPVFFSYPIN